MRLAVLVYIISSTIAYAQHGQDLVNSLHDELKKATTDTTRAKLFSRLSDVYIDIDLDQSLHYADSSMHYAEKTSWKRGLADAFLSYGNVYNFSGKPETAKVYLKRAIDAYHEIQYQPGEATSTYALGQSFERTSDFPNALKHFLEALHLHEQLPNSDVDVGRCLSGISVIYYLQGDYKKSLDYSFQALDKKEAIKNKTGVANELYNIGDTYIHMGDSSKAIEYNTKALAMFTELGNKMGQGNVHSSLAKLIRKDPKASLKHLEDAEKIFTAWGADSPSLPFVRGQKGQIFVDLASRGNAIPSDYSKLAGIPSTRSVLLETAEKYLQDAIFASREMGDIDSECIFYGDLAESQALQGKHQIAFTNYKRFHHLRDSLYSQESKNRIAAIESERELALRDNEIELNKQALIVRRQQLAGLSVGLVLLIGVGFILYRQNKSKQRINAALVVTNAALDEANKAKTKFFSILSHDLRAPIARLVTFLNLQKDQPDLLTPNQVISHRDQITTSAETLLDTMEDMLLWSKSQMDAFKPTMKPVPVKTIFDTLSLRTQSTSGVSINFPVASNLMVNTDENFIASIVLNLTANAINALQQTPEAKINWSAEKMKDRVLLTIRDNGPGISQEVVKNLLQEQQITGSRNGYGFFIIKDLLRTIGGSLAVESTLGKGTSFIISLPAA